MAMSIELNGQPVTLAGPLPLLRVLEQQRHPLHHPEGFEELAWINNRSCPLVNLVEVDGRVVSLAVWAGRPAREGMRVDTRSARIDAVLRERLSRLRDRQECQIIRLSQEFAAAEAESGGLIDLESRAAWNYAPRGSAPSIHHDPNSCVRCKACVDTCNEVQGVGALSFDDEQGVLFDETNCTRCGRGSSGCGTPTSART